jgi:ABC-type branched-subunit amino acid transport system ATPase component
MRATGRTGERAQAASATPAAQSADSPPVSRAAPPQRIAIPDVRQLTLEVRNLTVRFGGVTALEDVSLDVTPGKIVGLIGPNGAGKTTFVDAVTGFIPRYSGEVRLNGDSVDRLSAPQRARSGITRSFQSLELFEDLSVLDNLRAASDTSRLAPYFYEVLRPARTGLTEFARAAIDEFELGPVLDLFPRQLDYAQRRLVAIARAVASSAPVLLLDEPAAGLTDHGTNELSHLIKRLAHEWGLAVLMIEHHVGMVFDTCDHVVALNFGRTLTSGTSAEVRVHADVVSAYLGRSQKDKAAGRAG